jgi:antitoxin VapB
MATRLVWIWYASLKGDVMRAKLFRNGRSQAVRLPASFRFEGQEVDIRRDPDTGAVVLEPLRASARAWLERRDAELQQSGLQAEMHEALADLRDASAPQPRPWP